MAVNSTRTTAMAVVLAAFVAGAVIGVTGDRVYLIRTHQYFPARAAGRNMTRHLVDRLDRELHFDAAQRVRVESIIEQRRQRMDVIWSSVRPQIDAEIAATNAEIERVLTPEQLPKFKALENKRRNRPHHGSGSPPPPPPS